jgi:major membrane immunogen (membrane-anchored lipoprotein)
MKPVYIIAVLMAATSVCFSQIAPVKTLYKDGVYSGESQSVYKGEPYWGKVRVTIADGKLTDITFSIRDSSLHETFNTEYAKHFAGNEVYIQQTKNDYNGVLTYPRKLAEVQDTAKVDAISGATWSYNIFRSALSEAMKKAFRQ